MKVFHPPSVFLETVRCAHDAKAGVIRSGAGLVKFPRKNINVRLNININTHTHTYIYIYLYLFEYIFANVEDVIGGM